ncbi:MAG: phosphohistidine phosphatase SixA [Psychromonas sp.]|nr:phosphohistidine phosphatase SixA [Psychromonas sp.]
MQIYIMRHGQAEMMGHSDAQRELTFLGRCESEIMATYLSNQELSFEDVLLSPYMRAQQTWESVQRFFPNVKNIQTLKFLTPGGSVHKSVNEVLALHASGVKSLLIVSHLPLVGYLVSELVDDVAAPAFATSSVAHVELDDNGVGTFHGLTSVAEINGAFKKEGANKQGY